MKGAGGGLLEYTAETVTDGRQCQPDLAGCGRSIASVTAYRPSLQRATSSSVRPPVCSHARRQLVVGASTCPCACDENVTEIRALSAWSAESRLCQIRVRWVEENDEILASKPPVYIYCCTRPRMHPQLRARSASRKRFSRRRFSQRVPRWRFSW